MGLHLAYGLFVLVTRYRRLPMMTRAEVARDWSRTMLRILGIRVNVHGTPPGLYPPNTLLVSNHISWLDIMVLCSCTMTRFVAKKEIRSWPIIGWMTNAGGTLFIDRSNRRDASRINRQMADALLAGDCMAVFPEATTSDGLGLLPFKASLFESALLAGSTVQPVSIRYLDEHGVQTTAPSYAGNTVMRESLCRLLRLRRITVELTFGTPLVAGSGAYANRTMLAQAAQAEVAAGLSLTPGRHDTAERIPDGLPVEAQ
jgi:1-acyl-sn-glycerol-3-phosphate acyltransferase